MLKILNVYKTFRLINRPLHTTYVFKCEETKGPKKNAKRKVKETVELIMLIGADDKTMGLKPKSESETLAKKLNLTLQRIEDPRFGKNHPVYKLFSAADVFKSDSVTSSQQKKIKKLQLNSRIAEGDLSIKTKTIAKWIEKGCEVHVAVSSSGDTGAMRESVLKKLQQQLKDAGRFLNIRPQEDSLKFIVIPPKTEKVSAIPPKKEEQQKSQ